jgi:hypothetical protein
MDLRPIAVTVRNNAGCVLIPQTYIPETDSQPSSFLVCIQLCNESPVDLHLQRKTWWLDTDAQENPGMGNEAWEVNPANFWCL